MTIPEAKEILAGKKAFPISLFKIASATMLAYLEERIAALEKSDLDRANARGLRG